MDVKDLKFHNMPTNVPLFMKESVWTFSYIEYGQKVKSWIYYLYCFL